MFLRRHNLNDTLSEVDVLMLAAAVESNTTHPVGKAIVKAARAHNCQTMKVGLLNDMCVPCLMKLMNSITAGRGWNVY